MLEYKLRADYILVTYPPQGLPCALGPALCSRCRVEIPTLYWQTTCCRRKRLGGALTPRGPAQEEVLLSKTTLDRARIMRKVLKEAEDRYRNELLPDEERQLLRDRILRLRCQLRLA